MDTTAIVNHLSNEAETNTVVLLTNSLYQTVKYLQSELPGVGFVHEPATLHHAKYLSLLETLDITLLTSNKGVLDNTTRTQEVLVTSSNAKVMRAAYGRGQRRFMVSTHKEIQKLRTIVGDDFNLILNCNEENWTNSLTSEITNISLSFMNTGLLKDMGTLASRIHAVLDDTINKGICVTDVIIGPIDELEDVKGLKTMLMSLKDSLPRGTTMRVGLGQHVLASSTLLATRVVGKVQLNAGTHYEVDVSLFGELAQYLDSHHQFEIITDRVCGSESAFVYGNTGDEEDLLFSGHLPDLEEGDWLLLRNVQLADCRDMELILVNQDLRVIGWTSPETVVYPISLLSPSGIRVTV